VAVRVAVRATTSPNPSQVSTLDENDGQAHRRMATVAVG
jgi:hypothetical protein